MNGHVIVFGISSIFRSIIYLLECGTVFLRKQDSKTLSNQSVRYTPNQYSYIIQQCSYLANISLMHQSSISQAQILRYMHIYIKPK